MIGIKNGDGQIEQEPVSLTGPCCRSYLINIIFRVWIKEPASIR